MFLYLVGEEGREGEGESPESLVAAEPSCRYSELNTFKWKEWTHSLQIPSLTLEFHLKKLNLKKNGLIN